MRLGLKLAGLIILGLLFLSLNESGVSSPSPASSGLPSLMAMAEQGASATTLLTTTATAGADVSTAGGGDGDKDKDRDRDGLSTRTVATSGSCIAVTKSVQPGRIYPKGYGFPDKAIVTLAVKGNPTSQGRLPLDFVFVVDRSATIDLGRVRAAVAQVLELLGPEDRIGLVSFADAARTDMWLTPATAATKAELLQTIEGLIAGGKTACDAGVAQALSLLALSLSGSGPGGGGRGGISAAQGRPCAIRVILMLTDGMCTHGHEPEEELAEAVRRGIATFVVGVGTGHGLPTGQAFPAKIERVEGVEFFPSPAFFIDYLARRLREIEGLAGVDLTLVERLPDYIIFDEVAPSSGAGPCEQPVRLEPPDGVGLILKWSRAELRLGESWRVCFAISATKTGEVPIELDGRVEVKNPLTKSPMPPIPIPALTIRVENIPPRCAFTYEPPRPTVEDDINFYDESYDPFGDMITSWAWDFGDGTGSSKRNPTHRYRQPGDYQVRLEVCDEEGACDECSQTIRVLPVWVAAVRSALTFPLEQVLPGRSYEVKVVITPQTCINGMGLREVYPEGWAITPLVGDGAEFKPPNEWIWQGPVCPPPPPEPEPEANPGASGNPTVTYEVAIPAPLPPGRYPITGTVSSFAPRFEVRVGGLTSLEVVEALSIEVAVACLDVEANEPDPAYCYDEQGRAVISHQQIERAKELYRTGEPVPGTAGKVIDYEMMLKLLAYYETGTPVTQPLPND